MAEAMFALGSGLRDARLRRGLELEEVEEETRISRRYLRALEEERFELLPGDAYAKAFLRSYADFLGLDAKAFVDEYTARLSERASAGACACFDAAAAAEATSLPWLAAAVAAGRRRCCGRARRRARLAVRRLRLLAAAALRSHNHPADPETRSREAAARA